MKEYSSEKVAQDIKVYHLMMKKRIAVVIAELAAADKNSPIGCTANRYRFDLVTLSYRGKEYDVYKMNRAAYLLVIGRETSISATRLNLEELASDFLAETSEAA